MEVELYKAINAGFDMVWYTQFCSSEEHFTEWGKKVSMMIKNMIKTDVSSRAMTAAFIQVIICTIYSYGDVLYWHYRTWSKLVQSGNEWIVCHLFDPTSLFGKMKYVGWEMKTILFMP